MKMKRLISLLLSVCMVFSFVMPVWAEGETLEDPNKCGENVTWSFDEETGTLTISGEGPMEDYGIRYSEEKEEYETNTPWYLNELYDDITTVIVEEGVTALGNRAFAMCTNLESVSLPEGLTSIGTGAFLRCYNLSEIELPSSVEYIGALAFYMCGNLTSLTLPEGLTAIEQNTFSQCGLTEITIPGSVTSIGHAAFWRCENLAMVNFPDGLESIGEWAFSDSAITELVFPASIKEIGWGAFFDCRSLETVTFAPEAELTEIAGQLFAGCSNLATVELPDGLKEIGEGAFGAGEDPEGNVYACNSLGHVTVPESLVAIGEYAFGDSSLTGISGPDSTALPESLKSIGSCAFINCTSLTNIELPDSLTVLGNGAFNTCTSLESVELSADLIHIESTTFFECENLTSISIPEGVRSIGHSAFNGCRNLTSIEIPASVTSIFPGAFWDSGLETITYHGTEEEWDTLAKNGIGVDMESVKVECLGDQTVPTEPPATPIPGACGESVCWEYYEGEDTLLITGSGEMDDYDDPNDAPWRDSCVGVSTLVVEADVSHLAANGFERFDNLSTVILPETLVSIGAGAFANCGSLTEIELPEGLESIGDWAFNGSGLQTLTIPEGVKEIGESAFRDCENLTQITYEGSKAQWEALTADVGLVSFETTVVCKDGTLSLEPIPTDPVDPTPSTPSQSGGGDGGAGLLLAGGAAVVAAATGVYFYTHPDVLPAAVQKVKDFFAELSENVQSKVQGLLPVADTAEEEPQEAPAA